MKVTDPTSGESWFSKRRKRFEDDRSPRSLTFTCYKQYQFLCKDRTRYWLIDALQEGRSRFSVDLWAWVVMPEHVHLLVQPRIDGKDVSKFLKFVKQTVGRKAVRWLVDNSPEWVSKITVIEGKRTRRRFWQPGGGYDRNLESDQSLLSTIDYFHQNPVRRGLVEKATDWPWSSARWYANGEEVLLEMDRTLPTFGE